MLRLLTFLPVLTSYALPTTFRDYSGLQNRGLPDSCYDECPDSLFNRTVLTPNHADREYCSLEGRIKLEPYSGGSEEFQRFVGNNKVEISEDQERIAALVKEVKAGRYKEVVHERDLPELALAAYRAAQISIWDASTLLRCHQLSIDEPTDFAMFTILNEDGSFTDEAIRTLELGKDESEKFDTAFATGLPSPRKAIESIPDRQRIVCTSKNKRVAYAHAQATNAPLTLLFNRTFTSEPRLGLFSRSEVRQAFIHRRAHPIHIPCRGVPSPTHIRGRTVTGSEASMMDTVHIVNVRFRTTEFVDAIRELLLAFHKTTRCVTDNLEDLEEVSDMIFGMELRPFFGTPAEEFQKRFRGDHEFTRIGPEFPLRRFFSDDMDHNLFGWNSVLRMQSNLNRWRAQYGLDPATIPVLQPMTHLLRLAQPYLKGQRRLEKIYLLQRLQASKAKNATAVREFFDQQNGTLPRLLLERSSPELPLCGRIRLIAEGEERPAPYDLHNDGNIQTKYSGPAEMHQAIRSYLLPTSSFITTIAIGLFFTICLTEIWRPELSIAVHTS